MKDSMEEDVVSESVKAEGESGTLQGEPEELTSLREQADEWHAKADEWLDQYRRTLAEFANYRKRQDRDREQQRLQIKSDVLRRLLPIVDDLGRALAQVPADMQTAPWLDGVALIERKMKSMLSEYGVIPIAALGKPFDPAFHEGLLQGESEQYPAGSVMEELRTGYLIENQVLRPTQVKVSTGSGTVGRGK